MNFQNKHLSVISITNRKYSNWEKMIEKIDLIIITSTKNLVQLDFLLSWSWNYTVGRSGQTWQVFSW